MKYLMIKNLTKNPDENPELPMDFKIFMKKIRQTKSQRLLSIVCE
jgi:hypothetical protein